MFLHIFFLIGFRNRLAVLVDWFWAYLTRERIFEPLGMKETGFSMPPEHVGRMPSYYMTNFQTGKMELQTLSAPSEWTMPHAFPTGAAGLLSSAIAPV